MSEQKRQGEHVPHDRKRLVRYLQNRNNSRRINLRERRKSRNFVRTRWIFIMIAVLILIWGLVYVIF